MKWQVCSCSHAAGTEVLGVVEADNESDASQRANERFRPSFGGEDIIIRPVIEKPKDKWTEEDWSLRIKGTKAVYHDADDEEVLSNPPDKYSFRVEPGDAYFDGCVKDTLYLTFDRDDAYRILQDIITQGLGQEKDKFELRIMGKMDLVREEL